MKDKNRELKRWCIAYFSLILLVFGGVIGFIDYSSPKKICINEYTTEKVEFPMKYDYCIESHFSEAICSSEVTIYRNINTICSWSEEPVTCILRLPKEKCHWEVRGETIP